MSNYDPAKHLLSLVWGLLILDREQRLEQTGKCIFLGMKNACLIRLIHRPLAAGKFIFEPIGLHTLFSRMDRLACMEVIP